MERVGRLGGRKIIHFFYKVLMFLGRKDNTFSFIKYFSILYKNINFSILYRNDI